MRFPTSLYTSMTRHFLGNAIRRNRRFPLVLMLEPTHRCNLACAGCDRIRLQEEHHSKDLTLEECIDAAEVSGAPVVTITGGEPMIYPELQPLVTKLLDMGRHIYLCTNGILAAPFIEEFTPHVRLTLNFHIDGMRETHDAITQRQGTFDQVSGIIRRAKQRGFRVSTNTSVFKNTDPSELEELFNHLNSLGVDGVLVSPAFSYESVGDDIFMGRAEIWEKFKSMERLFKKFPFMSSPLYIDFLMGRREMACTPWGNPTRNPLGWKSPCYLITDAYYDTYEELMEHTDWDRFSRGEDPRCKNCMVHSGYEATVMRTAFTNPMAMLRLATWNLRKA